MKTSKLIAICAFLGFLAASSTAVAAEDLPQKSKEGMDLKVVDGGLAVYTQPGVTFSAYNKALLLDAYVGMQEDWVRDFNRSVSRGRRITDADLETIKERLATGFHESFSETLINDGGYSLVGAVEEGAIILRPALVDVALASPEATMASPSLTSNLLAGTGMTMILEIYDAATSEILARIYNRQEADSGAYTIVESSPVSRAGEYEIFQRWAVAVLDQLQIDTSGG